MGKGLKLPARLREQWPRLKYLMVGAFCALLNLLIQNVAVLVFGAHYVVASLLSFAILTPLSYLLHKKLTFEQHAALPARRFIRYTAQWTVLLMLNFLLLALFIDVLHLHVSIAFVLVALVLHVLSYWYARSFVFHDAETGR
jgi:putative flippase GtrA